MKLLLDTHIWIWLLQDSADLGRQTRHQVQEATNELWLSPISTWEALTLHAKGRINLSGDRATWLARATAGTKEAAITHEIALVASGLQIHKDPADRILCGTALVLNLTLVTADKELLGLGMIRTLGNR